MKDSSPRRWTVAGLLIALMGIPAAVLLQRSLAPDPTATSAVLARELAILVLALALIWIVRTRERLPLSSIGIRANVLGRSVAWGFGLAILCFGAVVACLAAFSVLGVHYGEGAAISRSVPVTLLTVTRAGFAEELFYRGYAIERLQSLTGKVWLAAAIPLLAFAGFHFRQGIPGMVLALILGGLLTAFYLWKRDLVATIVAHFLVDFVPNVLLPLLGASD